MKLFLKYLYQRRRVFLLVAVFSVIFCTSFLLYHLPLAALAYPTLLCLFVGCILLICDFLRVKKTHDTLACIRSITDTMAQALPGDDAIEIADYQQIIRLIGEEHNHYRLQTDQRYSDMIDYYTVWAHQIKTPIASMRLTLQNEDSPLARKLSADLQRIEQYVEMVLTFLRLDADSTDYMIREYPLDPIIRQAVRKFSYEFIGRKIRLEYEPVDLRVITDEKWLSFVIEQVLSNALKYTQEGSISIRVRDGCKLIIRDTGMGIAPEDLPRIFENGYTGFNGRTDKKASGIGLYLCKRICSNLGHTIHAESIVDGGTTIIIDLKQNRLQVE